MEAPAFIIGLGRGMVEVPQFSGKYTLTSASRQRAERMVEHYFRFKRNIEAKNGQFICSGGYAGLSKNQSRPSNGISEGKLIADVLVAAGVPSKIIEVEGNSVSTFDNFIKCVEAGIFADLDFSQENPLGVVASRSHFWRAKKIAQVAYGITNPEDTQLLAAEHDNPKTIAFEFAGFIATKQAVECVEAVQPAHFSTEELTAASRHFEALIKSPVTLLHTAIS